MRKTQCASRRSQQGFGPINDSVSRGLMFKPGMTPGNVLFDRDEL